MIRLDCAAGVLDIEADLTARLPAPTPAGGAGYGRELFDVFRRSVGASDAGASSLF